LKKTKDKYPSEGSRLSMDHNDHLIRRGKWSTPVISAFR
jgi:hypothetical protein